jgi:hypothetical protein
MVFGFPPLSNNLDEFYSKVEQIKYKISVVQFRLFERSNNFLFMSFTKFMEQKIMKPNNNNNKIHVNNKIELNKKPYDRSTVNNKNVINDRKEVVFKIKPDIQNDIYQLYCLNDDNKEVYFDTCLIPDFNTSVMMNKLFRTIKENERLDALEESDDEEEFENENEDRFVNLDKTYTMVCLYNYKFKKWYPVRISDKNLDITKITKLNCVR